MKRNEQEIKVALSNINLKTRSVTVQRKCKAAIAKIRAAQTLIEQAEATLIWAEAYKPEQHEVYA